MFWEDNLKKEVFKTDSKNTYVYSLLERAFWVHFGPLPMLWTVWNLFCWFTACFWFVFHLSHTNQGCVSNLLSTRVDHPKTPKIRRLRAVDLVVSVVQVELSFVEMLHHLGQESPWRIWGLWRKVREWSVWCLAKNQYFDIDEPTPSLPRTENRARNTIIQILLQKMW